MAIDSRNKRAACIHLDGAYRIFPNPDGSISQPDRQHVAGKYPGITAAPPGGVVPLIIIDHAFFGRNRIFSRVN